MEISLQSRLILAAKAAKPKSAEIEETEGMEPDAPVQEGKTDSVSLTKQAVETLKEQTERLKNLLEQSAETAPPLAVPPAPWEDTGEAEAAKNEAEAMEEQLKAMQRCMEIARRIMRGDKVPPEDMKYLMENDPEGFKLALAMRTPKKNPKEWESVLKDDKKSEGANEGGGEEAAPAESCGASEGASGGGTSDSGSTE